MRKTSTAIVLGLGMAFAGCASEGLVEPGGDPGSGEPAALREWQARPRVSLEVSREEKLGSEAVAVAFLSPFAATLPRELDVEAWRRVPGLGTAALRNCAAGGDLLVTCTFALPASREARVVYRVVTSRAGARFDCESRAGAGAAMVLDGGPNRWLAGRTTFTATSTLCFSTEISASGRSDGDESLRVATALGSQMGSPVPASCDGVDCEIEAF